MPFSVNLISNLFPGNHSVPKGFKTQEEQQNERLSAKYFANHLWTVMALASGFILSFVASAFSSDLGVIIGISLVLSSVAMGMIIALMEAQDRNSTFLNHLKTGFEIRMKMLWHSLVGPRR